MAAAASSSQPDALHDLRCARSTHSHAAGACLPAHARLKGCSCVPTVSAPTTSEAASALVRWPTTGRWLDNVHMAAACGCIPAPAQALVGRAHACTPADGTHRQTAGPRLRACCCQVYAGGYQQQCAAASRCWNARSAGDRAGGSAPAAVATSQPPAWQQWVPPCQSFCMLTPHACHPAACM